MKTLAPALCALALAACAAARPPAPPPKLNRWSKPYKTGVVVPAWVEHIPENEKGKLLAVGYSAPTYWPQDAINDAGEDARGKLALALTSHVEVLGIDSASGARNGGATINKEATDVVMQNSRIEATWVDENGDRSEPGGVFALASIDVDSARSRTSNAAFWTSPVAAKGIPAWLDHLPGSAARIYAAGYSGPTFEKDAAIRYAGDNAIENLAASLRAHVQAYTLLVESASGLSIDDFAQTDDPGQAFLEIVRKAAKVEATWVDKEGSKPGDPPGAVWALASIEVSSTKGGVQAVESGDLAPALDARGNAQDEKPEAPASAPPPAVPPK